MTAKGGLFQLSPVNASAQGVAPGFVGGFTHITADVRCEDEIVNLDVVCYNEPSRSPDKTGSTSCMFW